MFRKSLPASSATIMKAFGKIAIRVGGVEKGNGRRLSKQVKSAGQQVTRAFSIMVKWTYNTFRLLDGKIFYAEGKRFLKTYYLSSFFFLSSQPRLATAVVNPFSIYHNFIFVFGNFSWSYFLFCPLFPLTHSFWNFGPLQAVEIVSISIFQSTVA